MQKKFEVQMVEKTGMVDKICPIPPYSTIDQPPLEAAYPWRLCALSLLSLDGGRLLIFKEEEGDGGSYARRRWF